MHAVWLYIGCMLYTYLVADCTRNVPALNWNYLWYAPQTSRRYYDTRTESGDILKYAGAGRVVRARRRGDAHGVSFTVVHSQRTQTHSHTLVYTGAWTECAFFFWVYFGFSSARGCNVEINCVQYNIYVLCTLGWSATSLCWF